MEGLSIAEKEGYVRFDYTGEFSQAAGKQCIDAMVEKCRQVQIRKALLDCRQMTGEIPVFEGFMVVLHGRKMRDVISQTALVGREDQMFADNFIENVAVNRGVNLKLFTDIEEAIDWLQE